jgi:hypothetical protein
MPVGSPTWRTSTLAAAACYGTLLLLLLSWLFWLYKALC